MLAGAVPAVLGEDWQMSKPERFKIERYFMMEDTVVRPDDPVFMQRVWDVQGEILEHVKKTHDTDSGYWVRFLGWDVSLRHLERGCVSVTVSFKGERVG